MDRSLNGARAGGGRRWEEGEEREDNARRYLVDKCVYS